MARCSSGEEQQLEYLWIKVTISYLKTAAVSAEHCSCTRFILEHRSYVLSPENNQRVCSGHTRQTAFPKNNKWREPALLMPYWYPRAKQPAKCKSSYPSELHQMTENTQLCMTWVGGRVGHKDEQTISSCFTNRFSATPFKIAQPEKPGSYSSSRRNLRQSSTTCRFHTDPSALS